MKILMVLTSHSELGDTGEKTGFWLEEFAAPYYTFKDAGAEVVLVSPEGGQPPLDPKSDLADFQTELTHRFKADAAAQKELANTLKLASVNQGDFDGVFYPGGHGPLWDLTNSSDSISLIQSFEQANKPISFVCHAPAVLRHVKAQNGEPLIKGRRVTGFTNGEEAGVQLTDVVPFLIEDEFIALGGLYEKGPDWAPYVVEDGKLITGQNPASSENVAKALIAQLASRQLSISNVRAQIQALIQALFLNSFARQLYATETRQTTHRQVQKFKQGIIRGFQHYLGFHMLQSANSVIVLDFETTGLSPNQGDRAIEIGAVKLVDGVVTDTFQQLMNPGFRVSGFIEGYTGITNAMLRNAPSCEDVMSEFVDFLCGHPLVAHNASFDKRFLDAELERFGGIYSGQFACSMLIARRLLPNSPSHKLGDLVRYKQIENDGTFHRALADSQMTARLWMLMVKELEQSGVSNPSFSLMQKISKTNKHHVAALLSSYRQIF